MNKLLSVPTEVIKVGVETYSKTQHQQLSALHHVEFNYGDLVFKTAACSFEVPSTYWLHNSAVHHF